MKRCLILCSLIITTLILTWSTLAAGRGGQVLRWATVEHISIGNPPPPPRAIPRPPPPPPAAPSGSNP
ncbi:unnamed protein product, partial [Vitis vinifera]|uniref:Uncharacterized protein n=1 Tax=Vitis vinifera TaxID=29760 RepID=D7SH48_VITVI